MRPNFTFPAKVLAALGSAPLASRRRTEGKLLPMTARRRDVKPPRSVPSLNGKPFSSLKQHSGNLRIADGGGLEEVEARGIPEHGIGPFFRGRGG